MRPSYVLGYGGDTIDKERACLLSVVLVGGRFSKLTLQRVKYLAQILLGRVQARHARMGPDARTDLSMHVVCMRSAGAGRNRGI